MSELVYRNAIRSDVPLILSYIKKLAAYEKLTSSVYATKDLLEESLFDRQYAKVILVEVDKITIGFALYFFTFSTFEGKPTLYLEDLYIDEKYRGKGYGKKLLKELATIAYNRHCARFEWSCLDWNQSAIDFYLSIGATPQNGWTIYRLEQDDIKKMIEGK